MDSNDLYIYLLSGGSSALIELLPEEITLKDLEKTTQIMLHHGMPIEAMNVVRKSLSLIKGGKLALQSKAKGCVFVLSDVLGNDLSVIGSAPLYYTKSNTIDPVEVLYCYEVFDKIPKNVQQFLRSSQNEQCYDTATQIKHFLIGSNETVLNHAKAIIETKGIQVKLLDFTISGDVKDVAQKLCEKTCKRHTVKTCYIAGGEATVVVEGSGQGGRNQHLALHFLNMLQGDEDITFLSAATDGVDGNSNAAGAIVDWHTHVEALAHGLNAKRYLEYFDSNTFFTQIDALLVSGPTHNNLLDIVMIIVEPRIQGEING
jgi:glycerate-2-kinase